MSSAPTDCRVPDPTDAKADGNFGNHRAGYGDRLDSIITFARRGWSLPGPEGLVLVQEIDRLRKDFEIATSMLGEQVPLLNRLQDENDWLRGELELVSSEAADAYHAIDRRDDELAQQTITLSAEHQRAERILAKLREPSLMMRDAVSDALNARDVTDPIIGEDIDEIIAAAVAAAEQEVAGE